MAFEALVLTVLIASPGDTARARDVVESTIASWNRDRSRSERVVLQSLRWETDAVPELGGDGQQIINRQLVDEADIVVALFHTRLGAPTGRSTSGTAEEIERAAERGVPVHVYFSEQPVPREVDTAELARLNEFRIEMQGRGLIGGFASDDDLAAKVRTALERDVDQLVAARQRGVTEPDGDTARAVLRATFTYDREQHLDNKGRARTRTVRERLVIGNLGSAAAEDVRVEVEAAGSGAAPDLLWDGPIERILPQSEVSVLVSTHMGVASQWRVVVHWREGDQEFSESQSVTTV